MFDPGRAQRQARHATPAATIDAAGNAAWRFGLALAVLAAVVARLATYTFC